MSVSGTFWGSYQRNLLPGAPWVNDSGSTWVLKALLTSGTVKIGNCATGCDLHCRQRGCGAPAPP